MCRNTALCLLLAGGLAATAHASPAPVTPAVPAAPATEAPPALLAPLANAWPELDAATRARLRQQAAHWQALSLPQQGALRQRMAAWDALPATERARQRAAFAAWQRLSGEEQAQLRAAAAGFAALPPARQQALRAAFHALPPDQRQDWWLGPGIGADFARLRPLFDFVPEAERPALIALLGELSPAARADLALLARRLPASERDALRQGLLAVPPEQRDAWIRQRVSAPANP